MGRRLLTFTPAESLAPSRTYVAVLGRNVRDRRGNAAGMSTVIAFTTGDSLPSGRVSGKVAPLTATDAARVFALGAGPDTSEVPSFKERRMLSAAETDSGGVFHLGYLLPGDRVWLMAFVDRDATG